MSESDSLLEHASSVRSMMIDAEEQAARIRHCEQKLARIEQMARRHASPASNPGAHALASAIVRICEEK